MSGTLLVLMSLVTAPLAGDTNKVDVPRDTLVFSHEFTAATEFARLTLDAGDVYRVEVTGGSLVQIRALAPGAQNPVLNPNERYPRASRTIAFELAPSATTVYEIRVGSIQRGAAAVKVFWDYHATERRRKLS